MGDLYILNPLLRYHNICWKFSYIRPLLCLHEARQLTLGERTEFVWTLSWLAHGCSVGTDGICLDVIMVGAWMLCGNGRSLSGRYHGWHMDALWHCGNGRNLSGRYGRDDVFDRASPRNTVNTKGLEASTLALLLPPRTHERRSVFSCKVHEAPQIPMRSACALRAFTARRYREQGINEQTYTYVSLQQPQRHCC